LYLIGYSVEVDIDILDEHGTSTHRRAFAKEPQREEGNDTS